MRGLFTGLAGFFVAGVLLSATVGPALPDSWSADAWAAAGVFAALVAGVAGGVAGAWQGPPWTGIAGAALGALALIAAQPQADLITLVSLLAVLAGGTAGALFSPFARRAPHARATS
jgi:hypothetical protein